MWGGVGVFSAFTGVNHFGHIAFARSGCLLPPNPPSSLDALFSKYLDLFPLRFLVWLHGAWWVLLSGLSWLPSRIAYSPLLFHQASSPHPSIVNFDGFKSYLKTVRVNLYGAVKPELDILEAFGISCVKLPYFFASSCNLIYLVWFSPCGSEGLVISPGKGGEKWQQACKKRKTEKKFSQQRI